MTLTLILFFIFGSMVGSFINCLVWRLYSGEGIWPKSLGGKSSDRSYCPYCRKPIRGYDNIPIISFFALGGKCRDCKKKISWQYPLVELVTGLLFLFSWLYLSSSGAIADSYTSLLLVFKYLFIIAIMVIVFVYDLRWYLISNAVILPATVIILIINFFLGYNLWSLLATLVFATLFFGLQYIITKGRGIGEGDIWLGLLLAAIAGSIYPLIFILFSSYMIGSLVSIGLLLIKEKGWKSKLPLGVFLSLGTVLYLFFGQLIIEWYLALF